MTSSITRPAVLLICGSSRSSRLIDKHLKHYLTVISVDSAESGWQQLVKQPLIKVVICDLPKALNKFGLLERIRQAGDKNLAASPVLLLIGEQDSEADCERALALGATDFINLPFSSTELTTRARLHAQLFSNYSLDGAIDSSQNPATRVLQELLNETTFKQRLADELSFSQRHQTSLSVAKLRMNGLREIVSKFGKKDAARLVQRVARLIRQTLRLEDTMAYMGKAEFCILYPATNGIDAATAINRILYDIAAKGVRLDNKKVSISFSGSICSQSGNQEATAESILDNVEKQLSSIVDEGKNNILVSPQSIHNEFISLSRALKLIEQGATDRLENQASELVIDILPLLEYADQLLGLELKSVTESLRDRLVGH